MKTNKTVKQKTGMATKPLLTAGDQGAAVRAIKFAIYHIGKITDRKKLVGYERITNGNWEWMSIDLNPDKGERWTRGCFPYSNQEYIRAQFTGIINNDGEEIYEGDIVEYPDSEYGKLVGQIFFETQENTLGWYVDTGKRKLGLYTHMKHLGNIYENAGLLAVAP